ncbi:chromosome partitioning protein, ParB family [Cohaesibacter marisflavi]|uniref:Chromosome partitioning protein, ParB family n=1 Tax=Cohaesibacter marisflavi TaxID=655353 RepID=A0A1I5GLT1_9HYPH|nr:ParB/RepB/Spo0J family partition protein [Cohaesibacter marisflavi]SFO36968.1 chromosome partitioning protein, ParB family [Cohaesibacter marisflavi]
MAKKPAEGKRLGRGLAALIGDMDNEAQAIERARSQRRIPIEFLRPNPRNPRQDFVEKDLDDLTRSVKEKGIMNPILCRAVKDEEDSYEIIAGERRWRAAQAAGLHEVPVLIHDVNDKEALELAIIENVQRADLNALEEALGYDQLIAEFDYTQAELADVIGKSRSHVANTLRLLKLPESIKDYLKKGELTAGHARALITAENPEELARRIVEDGMTVRDAEKAGQEKEKVKEPKPKKEKDADTVALEKRLTDRLGWNVFIAPKKKGGELKIQYKSLEQLDAIIAILENQ